VVIEWSSHGQPQELASSFQAVFTVHRGIVVRPSDTTDDINPTGNQNSGHKPDVGTTDIISQLLAQYTREFQQLNHIYDVVKHDGVNSVNNVLCRYYLV